MKPRLNADVEITAVSAPELAEWFAEQATADMALLLAQADDGVIWGQVTGGKLNLAGDVIPEVKVLLRPATLQQARLFGPAGELLLWRDNGKFRVRRIADGAETPNNALPLEAYWLWGTQVIRSAGGFKLLEEGAQGLRHAPPIPGLADGQRAALLVRHYLAHDAEGRARISASRLCGLRIVDAEKR